MAKPSNTATVVSYNERSASVYTGCTIIVRHETVTMRPIPIRLMSGEEPFINSGSRETLRLIDFWKWAYSDTITNTTRGVLAEFLVAKALGVATDIPRDPWQKYTVDRMINS